MGPNAASAGLLILDCDGVLVDSEPISIRNDLEALHSLGWELTEEDVVERFLGRSHEYMVGEIEHHRGRPMPKGWEHAFQARLGAALRKELRPVPGIVEALDLLSITTCVASNASQARIERSLRIVGLYDRFAGRIFSASDVERGKPAPDVFLHAATSLGFRPSEATVVEDSPIGVAAARAAGMRVLGFAGGVIPAARLSHASAVFADMRELPSLLLGIQ